MLTAFLVLLAMAVWLYIIAYKRKDGSHRRGLRAGKKMLINLAPLLILAFLLAGFIQVAIPPELIHTWIGTKSGFKGICIGSIAGALLAGGPYVSFPVISAIYQSGAGIGATVALITGWAVIGLGQLPFELTIMGPKFMLVRIATVFATPFIAGMITHYFFG